MSKHPIWPEIFSDTHDSSSSIRKDTNLIYVVAGPEYWDAIPQTRQLTCGRVRFTAERIEPPLGAGIFLLKQQALLNMTEGQVLVRETFLEGTSWHYQLLNKK